MGFFGQVQLGGTDGSGPVGGRGGSGPDGGEGWVRYSQFLRGGSLPVSTMAE